MVLTTEEIKRLWQNEFVDYLKQDWAQNWKSSYIKLIENVKAATVDELSSVEFMTKLWDDNDISAVGQGNISVEKVIQDADLRKWFANLRDKQFPTGDDKVEEIYRIYLEALEKIELLCRKLPRLKLLRLMAALFPHDFTCITNILYLKKTARYFGVYDKRYNLVHLNKAILEKLYKAVGPTEGNVEELVKRSIFSWFLFVHCQDKSEASSSGLEEKVGPKPGDERLVYPPVMQRRKGLTSIGGYTNAILKILDLTRNGVTIDEAKDLLSKEFPTSKRQTISTYINIVRHELGLLKLSAGNILEPTQLGLEYLETMDPDVLQATLLTRIIGFEKILWELRDNKSLSRKELTDKLQQYYPGWTSNFMPGVMVSWSMSFDLIKKDDQGYYLTEKGKQWADLINEEPADIILETPSIGGQELDAQGESPYKPANTTLKQIIAKFEETQYLFSEETIAKFHIALHTREKKHFVLLSGLSGTGKTLLAQVYANIYYEIERENPYLLTVPVQPDWTDPSGLLGYINPLTEQLSFVRTPCLEFLMKASGDPVNPYFLCLDEMNLARVEYYFAPFLSAMETGSRLTIHLEESLIDGVPPYIEWPGNLFIIGTVNMDETTHTFSDKVLDRAFTMEFWDVDLDAYTNKFLKGRDDYPKELANDIVSILKQIQDILIQCRLHFGYRTTEELLLYIKANKDLGAGILSTETALDEALYMKILPKIRGENNSTLINAMDSLIKLMEQKKLQKCLGRLIQMKEELMLNGTTRFWR